jgi:hypothetical protein
MTSRRHHAQFAFGDVLDLCFVPRLRGVRVGVPLVVTKSSSRYRAPPDLIQHLTHPHHGVSTRRIHGMLDTSELSLDPCCIGERPREDFEQCHRPQWLPTTGTAIALGSREDGSYFTQGSLPRDFTQETPPTNIHRVYCTQATFSAKHYGVAGKLHGVAAILHGVQTDTYTSKSSLKPGIPGVTILSIPNSGFSSPLHSNHYWNPRDQLLLRGSYTGGATLRSALPTYSST